MTEVEGGLRRFGEMLEWKQFSLSLFEGGMGIWF